MIFSLYLLDCFFILAINLCIYLYDENDHRKGLIIMCKILCVDDDKVMLLLIEEFLECKFPSVTVVTHQSPLEAISQVKNDENISLVITDCDMGEVSGFDVIEACIAKGLPSAIMVSGDDTNLKTALFKFKDKIHFQTLNKPASLRELEVTIRHSLEQPERKSCL